MVVFMQIDSLKSCVFYVSFYNSFSLNFFSHRLKKVRFLRERLIGLLLIIIFILYMFGLSSYLYGETYTPVTGLISIASNIKDSNNYSLTDNDLTTPEPFILWSFKSHFSRLKRGPVLGDVNNDGRLDVIFSYSTNPYVMYTSTALCTLNGADGTILWNLTNIKVNDFALGDVNGNGSLEVIISSPTYISALKGDDGAVLWRFTNNDTNFSPPILGDIDNDGKLEVLVSCLNDQGVNVIYALNGENGSILWNITTNLTPKAIAYINSNNNPEIIASSTKCVCALNSSDGSQLWNFTLSSYGVSRSVAVGDINGDGVSDIVFGTRIDYDGYLVALNGEVGSLLWQRYVGKVGTEEEMPALGMLPDPVLADVDSDGKLEVITSSGFLPNISVLSGEDGSLLWTYESFESLTWAPPSIGDINGDNKLDVIVASDGVYGINGRDGTLLFNMSRLMAAPLASPALGDIDGDGKIEIVIQDGAERVFALDFYKNADSGFRVYWSCFGGNSMRSGSVTTMDSDMDMLSTSSETVVGTNFTNPDTDGDGMPDGWEVSYGLNATNAGDASLDSDGDGLTNLQEYEYRTDPTNADTDGDGMPDGWEVDNGYSPIDNKVPVIEFVQYNIIWLLAGLVAGISGYTLYIFEDKKKRRRAVEKEVKELLNKKLRVEGFLEKEEEFRKIMDYVDRRGLKEKEIRNIFDEYISSTELKEYEMYNSWIIAPQYIENILTTIKEQVWGSNKPLKLTKEFSKHLGLPMNVTVNIIEAHTEKLENDAQVYFSTKTKTIYPLQYLESLCDKLYTLMSPLSRKKRTKEVIMEKLKQLDVPKEDTEFIYELLVKQLCIQRILNKNL